MTPGLFTPFLYPTRPIPAAPRRGIYVKTRAAVAIDPYSGKALQYNKEKKSIYSVGQDRLDEHGNMNKVNNYTTSGGEWQNMYDPAFVVAP